MAHVHAGVWLQQRCRRTGCSSQLCAARSIATTCEHRLEYDCYQDATCARQADGGCGWTPTDALTQCLADNGVGIEDNDGAAEPPAPTTPSPCKVTGCSSQLCADRDIATTCEVRLEYACYRTATCEVQPDGVCGWTPTRFLQQCLDNPLSF